MSKSKDMIIQGCLGTECVDSSGEVLRVDGADISSWQDGSMLLNWEHRGEDAGGASGLDIVGKVVYAKKIFKESDCDDDAQRKAWKEIKRPIIWGVCRLFDGANHEGAKALAAIIRDNHAHGEPLVCRFSVEGSTLRRSGHVLEESVIRRCAITIKPCNRTAFSYLVSDPQAPEGFDKEPVKEDLLAGLIDKKESDPLYTKLGGSVEMMYSPFEPAGEDRLNKSLALLALRKAYEAGAGGGAPSTLTQGAALQREATPLRERLRRCAEDYSPKGRFDKREFREFAKAYLPEVDDGFLDHFAEVAESAHTRKLGKHQDDEDPTGLTNLETVKPHPDVKFADPLPKKVPKAPKGAKVEKPKTWLRPKGTNEAPPAPGRPVTAVPAKTKNSYGVDESGRISIPGLGDVDFHTPSGPEYDSILYPGSQPNGPAIYKIEDEKTGEIQEKKIHNSLHELYRSTVHAPWEKAMEQWIPLNKSMREGKTPRSLMRLAVMFAACSPNTAVPLQERHFGHIMDMIHEGRMSVMGPITDQHADELESRSQGHELPRWMREHYEKVGPAPGASTAEAAAARAGELNAWGNAKNDAPHVRTIRGVEEYARHLEHLIAQHGADGRKIAEIMMGTKEAYQLHRTKVGAQQALDDFHSQGLTSVQGYGPKLLRYALGLMGAGNIQVPDRHNARAYYNLDRHDPRSKFVAENLVRKAMNEPFLRAMDAHFYNKHPAVQYVLNHPKFKDHLKDHPDQAIFPAFWLAWLIQSHYERNQGRATMAQNGGTDHAVYFTGAQPILDAYGIPVAGFDRHHHHAVDDTSFEFGANVRKSERSSWDHVPLVGRALGALNEIRVQHGASAAMLTFMTHIAPALVDSESPHHFDALLHKFESLTVDLKKTLSVEKQGHGGPPAVLFGGRHVLPGSAFHAGGEYSLLGESSTHYVAVPADRLEDYDAEDLVRLPKSLSGSHFKVARPPSVALSDL